jgi:hypothetical protein
MASAAARAPPLTVTKPQRTKRNNTRRIVKINLELSPDRQQFANLFFMHVLAMVRLARHFFKMFDLGKTYRSKLYGFGYEVIRRKFAGFIVKAKQPSPCELGCLLIVASAVD